MAPAQGRRSPLRSRTGCAVSPRPVGPRRRCIYVLRLKAGCQPRSARCAKRVHWGVIFWRTPHTRAFRACRRECRAQPERQRAHCQAAPAVAQGRCAPVVDSYVLSNNRLSAEERARQSSSRLDLRAAGRVEWTRRKDENKRRFVLVCGGCKVYFTAQFLARADRGQAVGKGGSRHVGEQAVGLQADTGTPRHTQAHTSTHRHTQAHTGTHRHTQAHAVTHRHTRALP